MRTNNKHKKYENSFEQDFHLAYITRNVKHECNKKNCYKDKSILRPGPKLSYLGISGWNLKNQHP